MLLAADERGCVPEAALVAALSQGRPILRRSEGRDMSDQRERLIGESSGSDFFSLINAQRFAQDSHFNVQRCRHVGINVAAAREAAVLAAQFLRIAGDEKLSTKSGDDSEEAIARCILAGFPDLVALRLDAGTLRCALVHGRKGVLARDSVVHDSQLIVASEVREIEGKDAERQVLLTLATAIKEEWLRELFPEGFSDHTEVAFDSTQRRVIAKRITRFQDLVIRSTSSDDVPLEQAAALLAQEVETGSCPLKLWDNAVDQWILRLNLLADWYPEYELPKLTAGERRMLLEQICHGATSYREIKERQVWPVVKSWLSPAQQALLDDYAPERIALPKGRAFKITYAENAAPTVAVRIQDLYGVEGDLRIAGGRVPLVIQVLAPNHRPIQVTQNLANFWKESYPKIKQELQRKYPKHEWR
jgi:ATP-dependent helicase HrpB